MGEPIAVGVDLGTSNSSVSIFEAGEVRAVRNLEDQDITPSVVHLAADGTVTVGAAARELLETDRANCAHEFKRRMGTGEKYRFVASGRTLSPEEVSAHLLRALLSDVRMHAGVEPRRAVVTVPAMFEIRQCDATRQAAELAGLESSPLLQEPIAAAIAYGLDRKEADGFLLVYDLGGGTFDLTLLRAERGRLRVIDNEGDNFLGGRDFDSRIVDWCLARLAAGPGGEAIDRADPASAPLVAALALAAEKAKRALSQRPSARLAAGPVELPGRGRTPRFEAELDRASFESLIAPLVERTIAISKRVLDRNRLKPEAVRAIVPIGAPTVTPLVRRLLAERLGVPLAQGVDPKLTVSRGAAIYAASLPLEPESVAGALAAEAEFALELHHERTTRLSEIPVAGRIRTRAGEPPAEPLFVRIARVDGSWESPSVPVEGGSFLVDVRLAKGTANAFRVEVADRSGALRSSTGAAFSVQADLAIDRAPLPRSLGIAYEAAPGFVYTETVLPRGTPLPAAKKIALRTLRPIGPSHPGGKLLVHLLEGESLSATANEAVGTLEIDGARLSADLPEGSAIEFELLLDESRHPRVAAVVPDLGQRFDEVLDISRERATLEGVRGDLEKAVRDLEQLRSEIPYLPPSDGALGALEEALPLRAECARELTRAEGGDADSLQRLSRLVKRLRAAVAEFEMELEWPRIEETFSRVSGWAGHFAYRSESPRDLAEVEQLVREGEAAIRVRDSHLVRRRIDQLNLIGWRCSHRHPAYWHGVVAHLSSLPAERWTDAGRARKTLERMAKDLGKGDLSRMPAALEEIDEVYVPEYGRRLAQELADPGLALG